MTRAKGRIRDPKLDVLAIALWVLAGLWLGWQGALVYFVALMVGGCGVIYNARKYAGGRV